MCTTDDSRRRRESLTSDAGDEYKSETDLEEALMSGAHYDRSTWRSRGRLARSHSVCDTINHHSDVKENCSSRTQAAPGRGDVELRGERARRPISARRFRLTLLFDDGCSGRERVSAHITSTTTDVTSTLRTRTSSTSSDNMDWTHRHLDASSTTPKPRLRSSSVARTGLNRHISNSTSSLRDPPRSNVVTAEMKGQKDSRMNATSKHTDMHMAVCSTSSNVKKTPDASNQKDVVNSKKPPPPVRRTSLDVKANNSDTKLSTSRQSTAQGSRDQEQRSSKAGVHPSGTQGSRHQEQRSSKAGVHPSPAEFTSRQSTAQGSRLQEQRSSKAGVHPSGTMSANSSPRLTRGGVNHTARYSLLKYLSPMLICYT